MSKTVEFFYDFTSPTAYLAWARLPAIAERTGATIRYRPMFLGGVMQATGNRPPGTLPQKGAWMAADLARWAKRFNTPYKPNPHFPMMTLMVQRAAQEWVDRPDFDKYLAAIFTAAWRDQKNIADKAVLAEVLTAAGFSQEEFFAATENPALVQAFGINVPRMMTLTYGAGVALAAFAGVLAAPIYSVNPQMGSNLIIIVFAVVVIGGMGSILGSVLTGFGLGVIEGLTKVFYPEASSTVIFVVMAIVLLARPAGLFGRA